MTASAEVVHVVVEAAVDLLVTDGKDGCRLMKGAVERLIAAVDSYLESPELPDLVEGLLKVAHVVHTKGKSPATAYALCSVVEREPVIGALRAMAQELERAQQKSLSSTAEKFSRFQGDSKKTRTEDAAPVPAASAVSLDDLDFPRRA